MRHSTFLTSALAVGGLALPQGQLEKRQLVTVLDTVTVTETVFGNPTATSAPAGPPAWARPPSWAGPPKAPNPPNPNRPPFAPSLPVWTAPHPDAGRTSNAAGAIGAQPTSTAQSSSSTTLGTSSTPSSLTSSTPVVGLPGATQSPIGGGLSASTPVVGLPGATQSPIGGGQSSTPAVPGSSASSTTAGVATSATSIVGSAISNAPVPSNAVPTAAPTGAPYDPGHTPGAQQATLSVGQAYQDSILFHHNEARANHNAAPLYWNQTVADTAAVAANTCNFAHLIPTGAGQGQNLFTVSGDDFNVTAGITESWYKGEFQAMLPYFGKADIPTDVFHNVGHLTQVLWKATTSVGCVSIDCGDHMTVGGQTGSPLNKYTVCNYYPAGNVGTQYAINVGQPISTTNLGSWLD